MLSTEFGVTPRVRGKVIQNLPPAMQEAFLRASQKAQMAVVDSSHQEVRFSDEEQEAIRLFEEGIAQAQKRQRPHHALR